MLAVVTVGLTLWHIECALSVVIPALQKFGFGYNFFPGRNSVAMVFAKFSKETSVKRQIGRTRLVLTSIFLFTIVISTAYLQSILHFNTYLALAICMVDTIVSAALLFSH